MSVVTGALGSLAPKLLQLLHGEYKLQKGVRKQVEWLSRELNSIYAFLRKVSDVPWDRLDEQVKEWTREVREASYDMEDVLDTFLVRVEVDDPADPSRLKRTMKKMGKVFSKAKARRDVASAIEDIKKYLEEVAERRQRYKLDESISKHDVSTSTIDPRLSALYKQVTQLIGIDKSREELMSVLNPSHLDHDVLDKEIMKKVSIVGVGGLGKTTLAKAVYDKLSSEYECKAFVSVGRDRDLATVFKDMLFHLDQDKYHNIHTTGRGADLLIRELRVFLENKSSMDNSMQRDFVLCLSKLQKIQKIDMYNIVNSLNADTAMWEEAGFVLSPSLRHLNLQHCFLFSKMPSCINLSRLPNLSYLRLQVDTMDEQDMKHLARLPALSYLYLRIKSRVTTSITNAGSDGYFQKLRYFDINAMVQIQQHNKDDSCISLQIWNKEGALPFVSGKSNCTKNVLSTVMPNLEVLYFDVPLRALKDNNDDCGNIGIEYLPSISELIVTIDCMGVSVEEVNAALAVLRNTCKVHPNHPTLDTYKLNKNKIVSTQDNEDEKEKQEAEMVSQVVNNIDLDKLSP